ncbi:MAG: hypothetical protein EOP36_01365 [Rubrivivax sp.]|nr:MAG: hypothetical protein EOP36_01365 [Rubrivivax sp.]
MNAQQFHQKLIDKAEGASFTWGFVESMLFFLVPDMLLSVVAVHSLRRSLWCCLWAVAGAMAGGALMHAWGAHDAATALRVLDAVPAIPADMLVRVHHELSADGLVAMLWGPLIGIPYKIYAVQAGSLGLSMPMFLLMTIPARITRFVITCVGFHAVSRLLGRYLGPRGIAGCWALFWIMNYAIYWHATMRP